MKRSGPLLRVGVSVALFAVVGWWLDLRAVAARVAAMDLGWVAAALGLSVAQVALLAWRWCYTATQLGVGLPFGTAWREYYLSIFLNQVLPGGVLGDASRAWRQARVLTPPSDNGGPAARAVIFERLSAQAVMTTVAVVSLLTLPAQVAASGSVLAGAIAFAALIATGAVAWVRRQASSESLAGQVIRELVTAHFTPSVFLVQFLTAVAAVASYLLTFLCAVRAVGVETDVAVLLPLVAPVLMTMLLPVTVAGWGLREGAAAMLWSAVGLTAADGVVVSVAYGVLVLLSSLPGGLVLLRSPVGTARRTSMEGRS